MKTVSIFIVFLGMVYLQARDLGTAPIDVDHESRLYNIYKNFHSRRLTPTEWSSLIANISREEVNIYVVQKKDTLWDISKVLFDDPNYWPKIWSLNASIENPHQIDVGYNLMLIQGTEAEAPQMFITPDPSGRNGTSSQNVLETSVSAIASSCSQSLNTILERKGELASVYSHEIQCSDIQNRLKERRKEDSSRVAQNSEFRVPDQTHQKLGKFPRSLPPLQLYLYPELDFSGLRRERIQNLNLVERYLVERSDINSIGEVSDFDFVPIKGSEIIVEMDVPANIGSQYTLIRPLKKIRGRSFFIQGPLGHEVYVVATVRITAPVVNESGYYFAEVEELFNPIETGYEVVEKNLQYFDFEAPTRWGNGSAQIVGTSQDQSHSALMFHSFVYLNRGLSDGISRGETLQIWAHPRFHKKVSKKPLGNVLIVHTSDRFSTGFVTHLENSAFVGDYIRPHGGSGFISEDTEDVYDYEPLETFEEEEDLLPEEEDVEEESDGSFEFEDESSFQEDILEFEGDEELNEGDDDFQDDFGEGTTFQEDRLEFGDEEELDEGDDFEDESTFPEDSFEENESEELDPEIYDLEEEDLL